MRIVILGANGQVGAELTLMLAGFPGLDIRPVVRSRGGSAFLRYSGVPVVHGDIGVPDEARRLQAGADIIANFALALGTPRQALARNTGIIRQTFLASPPESTLIFFSTIAVLGQLTDRWQKTFYGTLKRRNEALMLSLARRHRRKAYVFRLGHVYGELQNITEIVRREIAAGPVRLPAPARASNVTFTETIAEALVAITTGKAGPPGVYDLFNEPQWTWREIYDFEARRLGRPLRLEEVGPENATMQRAWRSALIGLIHRMGIKERGLRLAARLPPWINDALKASQSAERALREIRELQRSSAPLNPALLWPAINPIAMTGVRPTAQVLAERVFVAAVNPATRWADDLVL